MIIVQLKGGLGNQLFQYAAGLSLAAVHNTILKVDIEALNHPDAAIGTYRKFDLQALTLSPAVATDKEISTIRPSGFFRILDKLQPAYKRKEYKESGFYFDTSFFKSRNNIYLKGYRQSEQYFTPIKPVIETGFRFKPEIISAVIEYGQKLIEENSISLHVRRGDYKNPVVMDYHGLSDASYYQKAIDLLQRKINQPKFYIFSDDPEWVQDNLQFSAPMEIISGIKSHNHFEDFHLISQCKHQIIANSTFSWWAAWLNKNPEKIVVAPKKWFNNAPYDTRDLIPETWIQL